MTDPDENDRSGPMALERGLDILEILSEEQDPQRFSDLVQRLGTTKAVTSRLLKALVARDMVIKEHDTGHYRRGPGLTLLARGMDYAPHTRKALSHACQARVATLSQRFGHTVMTVHWNGATMESVARHIAEDGLAAWSIGEKRQRLSHAPWGWIILHELHLQGDDATYESACAESCHDIPSAISAYQQDGWITAEKVSCIRIAAPIHCHGGRLVGVMGLFINPLAMQGHDLNDLGQALCETTQTVSHSLGADATLK